MSVPNPSTVEMHVHRAVNNVRKTHRRDPLKWDESLARIARSHSGDMARRRFVGHSTPTGTDVQARYETFDYDCRVPHGHSQYLTSGENIAKLAVGVPSKRNNGEVVEYETANDLGHGAVLGWMNSRGHRENLLRKDWRVEGIGVVIEKPHVFITQNFC